MKKKFDVYYVEIGDLTAPQAKEMLLNALKEYEKECENPWVIPMRNGQKLLEFELNEEGRPLILFVEVAELSSIDAEQLIRAYMEEFAKQNMRGIYFMPMRNGIKAKYERIGDAIKWI